MGVDLGYRGYDLFIEEPNSDRTFFCNICGEKTIVEKSVASGITIAKPEDDIGGVIRFVIIRKKFDTYKNIWR